VSTVTATLQPANEHLQECLFNDKWERLFFIEQWIVGEPDHSMPWELEEQRSELGAIFVRCEENLEYYDPFEVPRIWGEALFVPAPEVEAKREAIDSWIRQTASRDIHPIAVSYTLTRNREDFASLTTLPLSWIPDKLKPGDRFRYEGMAYPFPEARAIVLPTAGKFEITDISEDDEGEIWFQIGNLANRESLFISGTLMMTATFPTR
jgi:hypothetical protein